MNFFVYHKTDKAEAIAHSNKCEFAVLFNVQGNLFERITYKILVSSLKKANKFDYDTNDFPYIVVVVKE
jgi:hypothetical protein